MASISRCADTIPVSRCRSVHPKASIVDAARVDLDAIGVAIRVPVERLRKTCVVFSDALIAGSKTKKVPR